MSKITRSTAFIILPLLLSGVTCALAANQPLATAIARKDGQLLFVEVRVAGAGPFWFCLDTGAPHSIVDPYVVKQVGLQTLHSSTVTGTGQGVPSGSVPASWSCAMRRRPRTSSTSCRQTAPQCRRSD